ncbi:bestrophin-like domain [Nocardiopsis suaedae]|uniref:DUF4239 domain-containing protein n=1 Tax=Nocardiopsis suaedae TaxID=3018444 RepID=A0ABT4TXH1_9ACTN|nr:DUF4239 domain-containing protein [Nocardiopsis suaedae]MDA2808955.1 DUF4239 domain-containing protein [Nocardiopsis suaedae]
MDITPLLWSIAFLLLAALGVLLVRAFGVTREDCEGPIGTFIGPFLLAVYLIALAMGLVIGWDHYQRAGADASDEASSAIDVYWGTQAYSPGDAERVRAATRDYVTAVTEKDWPVMREEGELSPEGDVAMTRLRAAVEQAAVGNGMPEVDRLAALEETSTLMNQRMMRAETAGESVPLGLTVTAALSGLAVVVLPLAMGTQGSRTRVLWGTVAGLTVVISVAVMLTLNNPYRGLLEAGTDPYEDAVAEFDRIDELPPPT